MSIRVERPFQGADEPVGAVRLLRDDRSVASRELGRFPLPASSEPHPDAPFRRWVHWAVTFDVMAAAASAALAIWVRFGTSPGVEPVSVPYTWLAAFVVITWPLFLAAAGAYELRTQLFGVEELRRVLRTGVTLLATLGFCHFVFRLNLSRGYVGALLPFVTVTTAMARMALRSLNTRWTERGDGRHCVVAVGPADALAHLVGTTAAGRQSAIDVVAFVADDLDDHDTPPPQLAGIRRLHRRDDIKGLVESGERLDMLVRAGQPQPDELWSLGRRAYELGIPVAIAPHRSDSAGNLAVSYVPLGAMPLLVVETPTLRPVARVTKAVLDRVFGMIALVMLAPVMATVALVILLRDGRPVLYRQERVGLHGATFRCLKFRTMRVAADQELAALQDRNEADGPLFKIRDDPRVTPVGRTLRKYSLDELPQILQVLTGKMSIVGPRPPLPSEAATYDERTARRLLVKPGLTGLWQVDGRSDLPWDDGVYLDLMYIDHWSPLLDFVIMMRTIRAVIRPKGAY